MASIALRAYHRQIEEWIEQGLYDQAILHCRHILNSYPKCLDTYRLLGKAFLESQKFGDANDIFQRVLSSLPDDFVSHVGMSIIREDESNLNEAIWHMERAFEIQPSNNAVQGELRRLYGRRDGIEPPKVNLNRSALARMYLKGSLHSQAIAEIRMALAEDPYRPDLEVLLAKAYFETQKLPEAKEVANQLLAKLPYCYEAIYLLWQIALQEGKTNDAERYLGKLAELDPYAAHLNSQITSTEFVPDTAVILEKLDTTTASTAQTVSQPDWAASLGVQIPDEKEVSESSLPQWMIAQEEPSFETSKIEEAKPEETLFELSEESSESTTSSEIPDWMRELGWEESKLEESQPEEISPVSPFSEESDIAELESGEIPDWLREISPVEETDLPPIESPLIETIPFLEEAPPAEGDSIASWLAGIESESQAPPEVSESEAEELPDWVLEMNNKSHLTAEISPEENWDASAINIPFPEETPTTEPMEPQPLPPNLTLGQEDLPAWLTEEPFTDSEPLPDWLLSSTEEEVSPFPTEPAISQEDTKPVKVHAEEEITPAQPQPSEQPFPPMAEDEAFAWLESLAAKQGAQEALLLSPEERKEEPPEWIREYLESQPELAEPDQGVSETAISPKLSLTLSREPSDQPTPAFEAAPTPIEEAQGEELPEWLRTALEQEESELVTSPEAESEIPTWLASTTEEVWIQEFPTEETVETVGEPTVLEAETPIPDTFISTTETVEIMEEILPEGELAEPPLTELLGEEEFEPAQISDETEIQQIFPEVEAEAEPLLESDEEVASLIAKDEIPLTVTPEEQFQPEPPLIETARIALTKGLIDQALGQYQTLVKQRVDLDQIIQDISSALYNYPMEVRMWMLLGDAYLRKDLLSEALEAYNKAEELLR